MTWTRLAASALLLTLASPSHARFDLEGARLATPTPVLYEATDSPGVAPVATAPAAPLGIQAISLQWIEIAVRAPAGRTSQLFRRPPGGSFAPFRTPSPGAEVVVRDGDLRLGQYCYRLEVTGGGQADESYTRCATTDWAAAWRA